MATTKTAITTKTHVRNPLKMYFLLMTLVGVIGTLVSFGMLTYTVGKQLVISNDEYIVGDRYYEIEACTNNMIPKPTVDNSNNMVAPTEAEIIKCKADKKITLTQSRRVMFKTDVLGGAIWGILFLALLLIHYPKFMKLSKKGE